MKICWATKVREFLRQYWKQLVTRSLWWRIIDKLSVQSNHSPHTQPSAVSIEQLLRQSALKKCLTSSERTLLPAVSVTVQDLCVSSTQMKTVTSLMQTSSRSSCLVMITFSDHVFRSDLTLELVDLILCLTMKKWDSLDFYRMRLTLLDA